METVHYNVISILVQLRIKNTGWELRSNIYSDLFRYDDHYLNISGRKSIRIAYSRLKWVERHPDYGGSLLGIHDKLSSRSLALSHTTNFCLVGIIAINIIWIVELRKFLKHLFSNNVTGLQTRLVHVIFLKIYA